MKLRFAALAQGQLRREPLSENLRAQGSRLVSRLWELAHRDPSINVERWDRREKRLFDRCFKRFGKNFTHDLVKQARFEGISRTENAESIASQFKVFFEELGESVWVQITSGDDRRGTGFLHSTPRNLATGLRWGDEIEFAGGTQTRRPGFSRSTGKRVKDCDCPFCQPSWH